MNSIPRRACAVPTLVTFYLASSGCYALRPMPKTIGPADYAYHQSSSDVQVGLLPLFYSDKGGDPATHPFDVNLNGKRVLALQMEIQKTGDENLQIPTSEITLTLKSGEVVPIAASDLASKRSRRSAALVFFPWVVPFLSLLGVVVSAILVGKANSNMRTDFRAKSLPGVVTIPREQPTLGFAYFVLPKRQSSTEGMRVTIPVVNAVTGAKFSIGQTF